MISLCAFPWELHLSDPVRSENLRYSAFFSWAFSFYHGHKSETLGLGRNVNSWKQSFTQGGAVSFKIHPHLLASENFEHFIPQLWNYSEKTRIKWHPCNKKDQGISESGRKTASFRSVTTSLALLGLPVLPHHIFSMGSSVLSPAVGLKRGEKRGKRTHEKTNQAENHLALVLYRGAAVWQHSSRSGVCDVLVADRSSGMEPGGEREVGSAFWVLFPALNSALSFCSSCWGPAGAGEMERRSMECSASPIHRESWILSYYYSTDCKYLGDIYMVFLFKYIMFSFKSITILKRPVRGSDM